MATDQGPGFALPPLAFVAVAIGQPGYRMGVLDPQGFEEGFAAGVASILDETPPVVTVVTPPIGAVDSEAELVVSVTDERSLAYITVFALWPGLRKPDLVFRGGAFLADYTIGSFVVAIEGGYELHVRRDAGWPPGEVSLDFDVVDVGGNLGE